MVSGETADLPNFLKLHPSVRHGALPRDDGLRCTEPEISGVAQVLPKTDAAYSTQMNDRNRDWALTAHVMPDNVEKAMLPADPVLILAADPA